MLRRFASVGALVSSAFFVAAMAEAQHQAATPQVPSAPQESGMTSTKGQLSPEPYFTREHPRDAPVSFAIRVPSKADEKRVAWEAAYYDYLISLMEYNVSLFKWQQTAGTVILWLVSVLVVAGVIFSGFHLWSAAANVRSQSNTEIEISTQKVRITSSVIGLVILVLSLAFVYLFIREVYSINLISTFETDRATESKSDSRR